MRKPTRRSSTPTTRHHGAMVRLVAILFLSLLMPGVARAHFLWLEADRDGKDTVVLRAFLSETPTPDLPGGKGQGFAPSAFGVRGRLYVSGNDGIVYRLNASADDWEAIGKLSVPRIVDRLLPGIANDLLAVGGTFAKAPTAVIKSIPCE